MKLKAPSLHLPFFFGTTSPERAASKQNDQAGTKKAFHWGNLSCEIFVFDDLAGKAELEVWEAMPAKEAVARATIRLERRRLFIGGISPKFLFDGLAILSLEFKQTIGPETGPYQQPLNARPGGRVDRVSVIE